MVNDTLARFKNKNLLFKKSAEGLKVINLKKSKFYITPEIHKEYDPERPAINSINCHTSEILHFYDHHHQRVVK